MVTGIDERCPQKFMPHAIVEPASHDRVRLEPHSWLMQLTTYTETVCVCSPKRESRGQQLRARMEILVGHGMLSHNQFVASHCLIWYSYTADQASSHMHTQNNTLKYKFPDGLYTQTRRNEKRTWGGTNFLRVEKGKGRSLMDSANRLQPPRRAAAAVAHRFGDRARDEHQYAARRAACTAETRQRSTLADPFRTHYCAQSGRARDGAPIATGLNMDHGTQISMTTGIRRK
jgi:hypothetical protein